MTSIVFSGDFFVSFLLQENLVLIKKIFFHLIVTLNLTFFLLDSYLCQSIFFLEFQDFFLLDPLIYIDSAILTIVVDLSGEAFVNGHAEDLDIYVVAQPVIGQCPDVIAKNDSSEIVNNVVTSQTQRKIKFTYKCYETKPHQRPLFGQSEFKKQLN